MPDSNWHIHNEVDELIWTAMGVSTARRFLDHWVCICGCECGQLNESYLTGWFREAIAAAVITDRQNRDDRQG